MIEMSTNSYQYLDPAFNLHKGSVVIHKNNSLKHELAKFFVYWEETQNGSSLISEARFKGGKRADLFNTSNNTALEIVHSEGKESIERKKLEYPCKVIFLEADKVINYWLNKLNSE